MQMVLNECGTVKKQTRNMIKKKEERNEKKKHLIVNK